MYKTEVDNEAYLASLVKGGDFDAMSRGFIDVSQLNIEVDIAEIDK